MIPLFHISLPSNMATIFQIIVKIATFDIIPTQWLFDLIFNVEHTDPLSANFEIMGFDSLWIVQNLGEVFLITLSIPFFILTLPILKLIGFYSRRSKNLHSQLK